MDSFYDAPRQPPVPTIIPNVNRIPSVPEISIMDNSFLRGPYPLQRKQVRFEPPSNFVRRAEKENAPHSLSKFAPDLAGKTFKQIYMANVPNRHLDLSLLEPTRPPEPPKTNTLDDSLQLIKVQNEPEPSTYHSYSKNRFNCLKSIENTPPGTEVMDNSYSKSRYNCLKSIENTPPSSKDVDLYKDEPSIKDLYKIIQMQNEQISMLQKQVDNLRTTMQPAIEPDRDSPKKGVPKFSIQATSFEVSFRPPQFRKHEPKIQEIVECDNSKDLSLHLGDSLHVRDSYVSAAAVPSIHINMENYQDDETSDGTSFYQDLMEQVNNVLRNMQSEYQKSTNKNKAEQSSQTMNAVKQATLQHLKSIGVNLPPIEESSETTGQDYSPSEISFEVKQLLMKYLPSDKLAQVMNKPKPPPIKQLQPPVNSDFSMATLRYLQKYNIIDNKQNGKILDVTALKMQPKLL